jgi:hypothetical protein
MPTSDAAGIRQRIPQVFGRIADSFTQNSSSRGGASVRGSVIHTTESPDGSPWGIVNYFKRAGVGASSSYVLGTIDRGDGFVEVVRVVPEHLKPWTQISFNPYAVSYELVGTAHRTREQWLSKYRAQVRTAAALCAEDSAQYGLPVQRAVPGQVGHVDLSKYGFPQSHWDPGPGFPWDVFLEDVQAFKLKRTEVPDVPEVKAPAIGNRRPEGAPKAIPQWAWDHREWDKGGKEGPRPATVDAYLKANYRLPQWYWDWRRWYESEYRTRPADAPIIIPKWAWDHRKWTLEGSQGPRPETVTSYLASHYRLPKWYWDWRAWHDRIGGAH